MKQGIIMDLDGTLVDSPLNFAAIRQDLGLPAGAPILEAIAATPVTERHRLEQRLLEHEWAAAKASRPICGAVDFVAGIRDQGIRTALFTRNSREIAIHTLGLHGISVEVVVGREDAPAKPNPAGLLQIQKSWNLPRERLLYLGDYRFDLEAGRNAGIATWLYAPDGRPDYAQENQAVFRSFAELETLVARWIASFP